MSRPERVSRFATTARPNSNLRAPSDTPAASSHRPRCGALFIPVNQLHFRGRLEIVDYTPDTSAVRKWRIRVPGREHSGANGANVADCSRWGTRHEPAIPRTDILLRANIQALSNNRYHIVDANKKVNRCRNCPSIPSKRLSKKPRFSCGYTQTANR